MPKIHVDATSDRPHKSVERQFGKYNLGLYCNACDEFFAMAVYDRPMVPSVEVISNGEPMFECPHCHHKERRQVSEVAEIVLGDVNKRRPPRPRGLN